MEIWVAASTAVAVVLVVWTWRVVNWVWLKPKMLESCLRRQGVPGNSYTPIVGDLRKNSIMLMEAKSKPINLTDDITPRLLPFLSTSMKNYGKTFYTWLGTIPAINLSNPDHIKEVLNKVYDFPKAHTSPLARFIATGIVTYDGEKWTKHRRIISSAFHLEKIKNMVPAFYQSCSEMVNKWEKLVADKGSSCEVDVWPWLVNLTADVISRTAFGSSYEEGQRVFQLQAELARLLVKASIRTGYIPGWRFLPTRDNKRMKKIDQEIRAILRGVISKREKAREAGEAPKDDLLGILLQSNSDESQGDGMSVEEVIAECKLFYFAGQETTTVLLVWTMVLLSYYPDWQARAREEVLQVFGDKKPDFEGLNHLKVMTMIFYEVLRLYPPVVNLHRAVHKEMKLGDLTLPPGVQVSLPILLVHRNTKLWGDDAMEFKPERFKDGLSQATKNQVSFFPFAWGPRICIGQNFALLEAKMAMALILQRFSFKLSPSYTHAPCTVITIHPQFGAHLILHKV